LDHRIFRDLPDFLRSGDLLLLNESRVIPARLFGKKPTGGRAEILLVESAAENPEPAQRNYFGMIRPARAGRPGSIIELEDGWRVVVEERALEEGMHRLRLEGTGRVEDLLAHCGHMPLPPYIRREDTEEDRERYQTVYAKQPGSIAAPTAGLHFTKELLDKIRGMGVCTASVILHVGPGTFRPVRERDLRRHRLHPESYEIPEAASRAVEETRRAGGRIVCVGTTTVRAVEAAAAERSPAGPLCPPGGGRTRLFIHPPYTFQVTDALITNFHLPRSTLLMLVSAFGGREEVLSAYRTAVLQKYAFYSYGDAMLIL
ncbi:MAG: tRNA preQ1(34) S-adenosylmethionine ribosyltransferase-isomerase QueA, partial [Candidatus Eisenbacteria bacterium]|nr:tRNA preQ1(34) S-adenosylmethionine ribosyltransferase-isomerase QueA [Candidatus Eisenbacteria bacterium]